jgi:hypothetical protein
MCINSQNLTKNGQNKLQKDKLAKEIDDNVCTKYVIPAKKKQRRESHYFHIRHVISWKKNGIQFSFRGHISVFFFCYKHV